MKIRQFEYKPLAHFSYALVSDGEMAIIDPERNTLQYYVLAKENEAKIVAVIETHPHADFVSSHLQIHKETDATIYNSEKLGAGYPHKPFDEGDSLKIGKVTLRAINTPGHSPDSITIVAAEGRETVLFTGDTLFIGDVGRPDLREKAGNMTAKRKELAEMMYDTIKNKYNDLPDEALVYPAHGAGSLCGKSLSSDNSSTLGNERLGNWAFKKQSKEEFIDTLLDGQPFIPSYFGFNVDINKAGAETLRTALATIPFKMNASAKGLIVDTRAKEDFKRGHLYGSINIQATSEEDPFETWLGSIIEPGEKFHLVIENPVDMETAMNRIGKIGYEEQLQSVLTLDGQELARNKQLNLQDFEASPEKYTIIDVRNKSEVDDGKFFDSARSYPLNDLRKTANEIPTDKPVVVHCAGGYRSAAGSSILSTRLKDTTVYDLGEAVRQFKD